MNIAKTVRIALSVFLAVLAVISVGGFVWWGNPPAPLASYSVGGRVILSVTLVAACIGLFEMWRSGREAAAE